MEKKEIYEHLAKIYLDASLEKKKKFKEYAYLIIVLFIFALISIPLYSHLFKKKSAGSEIALVLCHDKIKINFHFDPVKKEIYSIDLKGINLGKFKALAFSAKKADYKDKTALRVEFTNAFREKSEIYIQDISHRWRDYKLKLADFKNITEWSNVLSLSFIVEEWNVKEKKGILYLDNICLLKYRASQKSFRP